MIPKVDTFEHDIADEIRRKEANLAEIQAISKQNSPAPEVIPQKKSPISIILGVVLVLALLGIGGVAYYYYNDSLLPPSAQELEITKKDLPKQAAPLAKISPILEASIGRFVTSAEKNANGYIISINNYTAVFGYMTRNENLYIGELATLFTTTPQSTSTPQAQDSVATTTQSSTASTTTSKVASSTPQTKKSTKTATSTQGGTSTQESVTSLPVVTTQSYVTDLTLANQNMRVYKKDGATVVYAFVGNSTVLISNSPEGILALKSVILRK